MSNNNEYEVKYHKDIKGETYDWCIAEYEEEGVQIGANLIPQALDAAFDIKEIKIIEWFGGGYGSLGSIRGALLPKYDSYFTSRLKFFIVGQQHPIENINIEIRSSKDLAKSRGTLSLITPTSDGVLKLELIVTIELNELDFSNLLENLKTNEYENFFVSVGIPRAYVEAGSINPTNIKFMTDNELGAPTNHNQDLNYSLLTVFREPINEIDKSSEIVSNLNEDIQKLREAVLSMGPNHSSIYKPLWIIVYLLLVLIGLAVGLT